MLVSLVKSLNRIICERSEQAVFVFICYSLVVQATKIEPLSFSHYFVCVGHMVALVVRAGQFEPADDESGYADGASL